jgi:hypothetical protein
MKACVLVVGALGLALVTIPNTPAQERKKEPLVEKVKTSIDRGVKFLRQSQRDDGSWEVNLTSVGIQGGWTSLAVLSLLNCGLPVDDPMVAKGLKYLRGLKPSMTYVRALQTMVFVEAGQVEDKERIRENVKWLIDARVLSGNQLRGWTYQRGGGQGATADNSNTQYALLGLWAGRQGGVEIKREIWESIRDFYVRTQEEDGGWGYAPVGGPGGRGASLTMTTAGVCSLFIAAMELNAGREQEQGDGSFKNCGVYADNKAAMRGLSWISNPGGRSRFELQVQQRTFYNLYGIERAGRLSGMRFFGAHDWYREGCDYLVREQQDNGSWHARGVWDQWPVVSTSFSLLFLSKGRTPVLISKLVHGAWPRRDDDLDWNNDRNDLRHLTDFASKELFKNIPLAWQTFDILRAATPPRGTKGLTEDDLLEITSDMLQSPIFYFNGHKSPHFRFSQIEKDMLKRYVDNGGFLLVEACCASADFDRGFKALAQELWPDSPLEPLPGEHPIWGPAPYRIPQGSFGLMGIQMGCKTVVVYSPQDLSCWWESKRLDDAKGLLAFRTGANIIAYATGMEPPRPRLSHTELARQDDSSNIRRGFLKVAQLKHGGDWQTAPRAMSNLMDHLRKFAGLDVTLKTQDVSVLQKSLIDHKFVYMHGRREFRFDKGDIGYLKFNLENGGLLFADACCGKQAFDTSFRAFVKDLFPEHKLEPVPLKDDLYSKELNGEDLTENNIRARKERGGQMANMAPHLEGIKLNGRWVLLYSKYDIGCALERHQASDCLGYSPESALKIAGAAVLYTLRP